eukprot:4424964-Ditylum_brightwellii.AAC.1
MAFTSELLIGMVYAAMTTDWPSGLASKIVVVLHKKYAPQDIVAKIELRRALNSVLMKRKDNPVVLFDQISRLQNRYNTATFQVSMEEQIAMVLDKAPMKYSTVLTCEQRTRGQLLTINNLQSAMTQLYCTMYKEKKVDNEEPEVSFSSMNNGIKRYNCSEKGHNAYQCTEPKKRKNKGRNNNKKCGRCGNNRHDDKNC